jgi:GAF domain-containing protein
MTDNCVTTTAATAADPLSAELLQSIVDVARAIFGAQASSVFLLDHATEELVFHSVSGRGEGTLVGRRFPATSGIAGWVAVSGEPMVVNDLAENPAFDREIAESTEYVPRSLMAAPLLHDGEVLGVLEVLDPAPQSRSSLNELDLLGLFARQAAVALRVVMAQASGRRSALATGSLDAAARDLMASLQRLLQPATG